MHSQEPARLQLSHITKRYPGVVANRAVSLTVRPGEAHAVLGENGAGKSTLMKIIYGSVKPDEGEIHYNGLPVHIKNPQQSRCAFKTKQPSMVWTSTRLDQSTH